MCGIVCLSFSRFSVVSGLTFCLLLAGCRSAGLVRSPLKGCSAVWCSGTGLLPQSEVSEFRPRCCMERIVHHSLSPYDCTPLVSALLSPVAGHRNCSRRWLSPLHLGSLCTPLLCTLGTVSPGGMRTRGTVIALSAFVLQDDAV